MPRAEIVKGYEFDEDRFGSQSRKLKALQGPTSHLINIVASILAASNRSALRGFSRGHRSARVPAKNLLGFFAACIGSVLHCVPHHTMPRNRTFCHYGELEAALFIPTL